MKAKTRFRLVILLAVCAAAGAAGGGFIAYRRHVNRVRDERNRAEGLAAFGAGNYSRAMELLGEYEQNHEQDTEVLYAMARARLRTPDGSNFLGVAANWFGKVVELDPSNEDAQKSLLHIYQRMGPGARTETVSLANTMLPGERAKLEAIADKKGEAYKAQCDTVVDILRAKGTALFTSLDKFAEARQAYEEILDLRPLDIDAHQQILRTIEKTPGKLPRIFDAVAAAARPATAAETYVPYAKLVLAAHPRDASAEVIASVAYLMGRDMEGAQAHVRLAATYPITDSDTLSCVVRAFDILNLFSEGTALLESRVKANPTDDSRRDWTLRLFYLDRFQEVLDSLNSFDLSAPGADADMMAAKAYALVRLGRNEEALPVLKIMQGHAPESRAAALGRFMEAYLLDEKSPRKDRTQTSFDAMRAALAASLNDSPLAVYLFGNANALRDNQNAAVGCWQQVERMAPVWADPYLQTSRNAYTSGRFDIAVENAYYAQLRLPESRETMVAFACAWARCVGPTDQANMRRVLDYVAKIPVGEGLEPTTLPIKILFLSRMNKKPQAVALVQQAMAQKPALEEGYLINLAQECLVAQLQLPGDGPKENKLVDGVLAACESAHGLTANLAYFRAILLSLKQDGPSIGLKYLEGEYKKQPANDADWQLVWAKYLDMVHDPRARQAWLDIVAAHPEDPNIQWDAVQSVALEADFPAREAILNRLETLSSDRVDLNLYRAKWILASNDKTPEGKPKALEDQIKGVQAAEQLLKDALKINGASVEARMCHAKCLELLDGALHPGQPPKLQDAIADVKVALTQAPNNTGLILEYTRLLLRQGEFSQVPALVSPVLAKDFPATDDQKWRAAQFLAEAGKINEALAFLKSLPEGAGNEQILLLARLMLRTGDAELKNVEPLVGRMMEHPDMDSVQFAADFYAGMNRPAEAQAALALLDKTAAPPVYREMARAAFYRTHGTGNEADRAKEAEGHVLEAIRLDPTNRDARRQLVVLRVLESDRAGVQEAIVSGAKATKDQVLSDLAGAENLPIFTRYVDPSLPGLQDILISILGDVSESTGSMDALKILAHAQDANPPEMRSATAQKLRPLADANPHDLALQMITIQVYASCGRIADAKAVADRAMEAFPNKADPAKVAASTMAALGQWDDVVARSQEWKRRAPFEAVLADMSIADAYVNMGGRSADAMKTLDPYVERAKADPDHYGAILMLEARALLQANRFDDARALMRPLNARGQNWCLDTLTLINDFVKNEKVASDWMAELDPLIPAGTRMRAQFAQVWYNLGDKLNNRDFTAHSRDILQQIAGDPKAPPEVITTLGAAYEVLGDARSAEVMYDRALKADAKQVLAANNLAMIYMRRGEKLDAALKLIDSAITLMPNFPSFHDTRAAVLNRQGNTAEAIKEAQIAIRLDSGNAEWQLTLLDLQVNATDEALSKGARNTLTELDSHAKSTLTPEQVKRLEALRLKVPRV